MDSLTKALANLDLAFAGRWTSFDPGGCERCFTAEQLAGLSSGQMPDETVLNIFGGWPHRWHDMGELVRRLAPRFLRLLVRGEFGSYSYEDLGELFWDAGWMAWPQRDAVQEVFQAWWRATLTCSTLEFLIPASHQVLPWLRELENSPQALPAVLDRFFHPLASGDLQFGDYDATDEATGWLLRHGIDLLARLPEGDEALRQLADLELCVQSRNEARQ